MKTGDIVALVLVVVGAINWGLVGAAKFDLVKAILGDMTVLSRIVYILVGLAGIYLALASAGVTKRWVKQPVRP